MIRPRRYFPWKIASHYALRMVVFHAILLATAAFSLRYYVFNTFWQATDRAVALGHFDDYLTSLGFGLFAAVLAFTAWSARLYFYPMGRQIQRARELRREPANEEAADEDFSSEEPGEWADLERALGRIHSDLRVKTGQLAREREELAALIGAVSNAIIAVDSLETPLFFNSQFALLFGVKSGAASRSLRLGEIFRSPDVLRAFREVLKNGQAKSVGLSLHTSRHNLPRHFSLSVAPLRDKEDSVVYGAVGIFHDVTELKQAEQIRIEFVGNASHELRTPLTSIKGYLETVKEDVKSGRTEGLQPFLDVISRNVDRLILLVNDLLDLSTIESGAELQKTAMSTREVTEAVLRQLEGKRAAKRIEVHSNFGAETLQADARRVEQVLLNLAHNAIKYIPDGGRIDVRWSKASDGATLLSVKDNGPGIPSGHQSRLFERFYRIDPGRSRDQGGTGLGLSIVKHIMIKHGGSVQLQSRLGEGAEFICVFP